MKGTGEQVVRNLLSDGGRASPNSCSASRIIGGQYGPGTRGFDGGGLQAAKSFLAARFRPLLFWPRPIAFANSDRALA
jgi:hypothetical protein